MCGSVVSLNPEQRSLSTTDLSNRTSLLLSPLGCLLFIIIVGNIVTSPREPFPTCASCSPLNTWFSVFEKEASLPQILIDHVSPVVSGAQYLPPLMHCDLHCLLAKNDSFHIYWPEREVERQRMLRVEKRLHCLCSKRWAKTETSDWRGVTMEP